MSKFFKGALWGGLAGAGLVLFSKTKRGKELQAQALLQAETVMNDLLKRIPPNEWVDEKKVRAVAKRAALEYAETKDVVGAAKSFLWKEVKKQLKKKR
jgi:gas vesicle protein